ncbi:SurA N-terminal domain-containing protein [Serpentinicella sp. ANB-PHB4]|uniref:SurA N-terminal domain-containing protein n=1 Tax=Serpentinicella sp. ANB-PHB4 TaxID=3074076 RepID=UPI00285720A4|nr:SurA N-terminal domain-containing protein [Serpentinicella sp. ANB-PHB4]MDR5659508.1 SurA N-terminal domain-containing protein [Serpentinicella sp. ANB-PHB4]
MFFKKKMLFTVVALIGILLLGCSPQESDDFLGEYTGTVVAKVNGVNIGADLLQDTFESMKLRYETEGMDFDSEEGQEALEYLQEMALDQLVQEEVLVQASKEVVSDDALDERLNEIKSQFPSEDEYLEILETQGITEEFVVQNLRIELFMEKQLSDITVTDEELEAAYDLYILQAEQADEEVLSFEEIKANLEHYKIQVKQQDQFEAIIENLMEESEIEKFI